MLRIYGKQLGDLGIHVDTDKYLYIDIDHEDVSEVNSLPPTVTYIITNRTLADWDEYINKGYFNICMITSASAITKRFIATFIAQDYEDNHIKVVSQRLAETYSKGSASMHDLQDALTALRNDDSATFAEIMSRSLNDILLSLKDIDGMIAYCNALSSSKASISKLMSDSKQLDQALQDKESFRVKYEQEHSALVAAQSQLTEMMDVASSYKAACNSHVVTSADVQNHKEFLAMKAQRDAADARCKEAESKLKSLQDEMDEKIALMSQEGKNSVIKQLTDELAKAKSMAFNKMLEAKLPVFQASTSLDAETILYFKEVRPTVYIDGLARWMQGFLNVRYANRGKSYLIVIFDPMIDEYTAAKYNKHGWLPDEPPTADSHILVTKILDYGKLKKDYMITSYNLLIVIDRCHIIKDAVDMPRAKKYFFINTPNDITDFNLEPCNCIGFFNAINSGVGKSGKDPRFHINPWTDHLAAYDTMPNRSGKFTDDAVFTTIFKEAGIGGE